MANKIVLVSDDSDFFDYIKAKLEFRKSDELFSLTFSSVLNKLQLMESSVLIVNSENARDKTLQLLDNVKDIPVIVSAFNDDETFRKKCYQAGAFDFITILISDSEFMARIIPALSVASILEKNKQYRNILVQNKIISEENEVFIDYEHVLDSTLNSIEETKRKAVFAAVSPAEKAKFLLQPGMIETAILRNLRRNDILMNYAPNKYFILIYDVDIKAANILWEKVISSFPQKLYAGFAEISHQKRQQLINEVLNKLHEAINYDKNIVCTSDNQPVNLLNTELPATSSFSNFKLFRQEFDRKIEQVITPVFYQMQQKYSEQLMGATLQQGYGEGYGTFYIKGKYSSSCFRITRPGFSKINIDITYQKDSTNIDAKRITLEPEELEAGLLEDLLEQFISEYKRSYGNDT